MKKKGIILLILITAFILLFVTACKKDETGKETPAPTATPAPTEMPIHLSLLQQSRVQH